MDKNTFEDVEINVSTETLGCLYNLAFAKLTSTLSPCSMSLLEREEISTCEELANAIGKAYVNELFVEVIQAAIAADKVVIEETDEINDGAK